MKTIRPFLFCLTLSSVLLSGCTAENQSTPQLETKTNLPIPLTATSTPTTVPTMKSISTLSPDQAYGRLNELFTNDSDCRLPCWNGINPGLSTLQDLHERMIEFSGIAANEVENIPYDGLIFGEMQITYPSKEFVIEINTNYISFPGEEMVSAIEFYTRTYQVNNGQYDGDVYGYQPYNELLDSYTLSRILYRYGLPDQMYVLASLGGDSIQNSPGFDDYFEIGLWYPGDGTFMAYRMSIEGDAGNYRFCPSNAFILGTLIPSTLGNNYKNYLLGLGDAYQVYFSPSKFVKSPEEAIGLTKDEFYELFRLPTTRCVETPKAIWWPQ